MTDNLTISRSELEAIRSVERALVLGILPVSLEPITGDVEVLGGLLKRLATYPPPEEVASRQNGGNWASKGNWAAPGVKDDCADGTSEPSDGFQETRNLVHRLSKIYHTYREPLPETLRMFIEDALNSGGPDALRAGIAAMDSYTPDMEDDIPV